MISLRTSSLFLLQLCTCAVSNAQAGIFNESSYRWLKPIKLAAEIVLPSSGSAKNKIPQASESRMKAKASISEEASLPDQTIIIISDDPSDEGVSSRPRMSSPPDNRAKAKAYSAGSELPTTSPMTIRVLPESVIEPGDASKKVLETNVSKARSYSDASTSNKSQKGTHIKIGTSTGVLGSDGIMVLDCGDTNNTSGHIGDDTYSGSYFNIYVNGKPAKARCR